MGGQTDGQGATGMDRGAYRDRQGLVRMDRELSGWTASHWDGQGDVMMDREMSGWTEGSAGMDRGICRDDQGSAGTHRRLPHRPNPS